MTKKINRSVLIISIVLLQLTLFVYGKDPDGVKEIDRIKNVKQENVSFQKPHRQIVSN
jgi:hypothetical protein